MAVRGSEIIVSANPHGRFMEGIISGTPKPGTIVQLDLSVAPQGGRFTWKVYDRSADGDRPAGPFIVLLEDRFNGNRTYESAYASGDRCFGYVPLPGDELNLRFKDIAGTADDHAAGEMLIVDDGSGLMIATTGSPQTEVAINMEAITDPVADTLGWVTWTGY